MRDACGSDRSFAAPLGRDGKPDAATGTLAHAQGRGATIRATSEKIGMVEGSNEYGRTGEHVPMGMFIWSGPEVSVAARNEPVSVMDFHPTICRLLGLATPRGDGNVIHELASC